MIWNGLCIILLPITFINQTAGNRIKTATRNMKKMILIAVMLFVGMITFCYGQNVNVSINNENYSSTKDCEFKINGICSSEDIGGVEIQGITRCNNSIREFGHVDDYAIFTNYNGFPVTVLFKYGSNARTIILKKGETKEVWLGSSDMYGNCDKNQEWPNPLNCLEGPIVRKLQQ